MAKKKSITETGPKPLRGIRNSDLYSSDNTIDDLYAQSAYNLYRTAHGNIGYDAALKPSLYEVQEVDSDFGSSMFDKGILVNPVEGEIQNRRAYYQPGIAKLGAGLVKGITTAASTFIDNTLGLLTGAAQGVYNMFDNDPNTGFLSGVIDNPVTRAMKDFNDAMEEAMPNYYSEDEITNPMAFRNLISANFLGDKVLKNLGFVVGSIYSGGGWGTVARTGLRGLAAISKGLLKSTKLAKGILKASPTVSGSFATFMNAVGESSMEALSTKQDFEKEHLDALYQDYEDRTTALQQAYADGTIDEQTFNSEITKLTNARNSTESRIKKDAISAANTTFGINMPLVWGADAIWLGKAFSRGFSASRNAARPLSKNIKGSIRDVLSDKSEGLTANFTKRGAIWNAVKGPLTEGAQEFGQSTASDIAKNAYGNDVADYYKAALDGKYHKENIDWVKSINTALSENLNSQDSWSEFLLGSLTSLMGAPKVGIKTKSDGSKGVSFEMAGNIVSEMRDYSRNKAETIKMVDAINNRLKTPEFQALWTNQVQHRAYQDTMDKSAENGDKFSYKNAEESQLNSDIELFHKLGRTKELKEYLKELGSFSDEQVTELINDTTQRVELTEADKASIKNSENSIAHNNRIIDQKRNEMSKYLDIAKERVLTDEERDQYFTLSEEIKDIEEANRQFQTEIDAINNKQGFSGAFVDENGNAMDVASVKSKINDNVKKLSDKIDLYGETRERLNNITGNSLSQEALGFITNMALSEEDTHRRLMSLFDNELKDSLKGDFYDDLIEAKKVITDKEKLIVIDQVLDLLKDIRDNKSNSRIRRRSIDRLKNPDFVQNVKNLLELNDRINTSERAEIYEALDDVAKLADRAFNINKSLEYYLKSNDRIEEEINKNLDEAIAENTNKRINDTTDKLRNANSKKELSEALADADLTPEDLDKAIESARTDNPLIDGVEALGDKVNQLIDSIEDVVDSPEDSARVARLIGKISQKVESVDDFYEALNPDNIDEYLEDIRKESESIDDYEDKKAKILEDIRKVIDKAEKESEEAADLKDDTDLEVPEESEPIKDEGKDGPSKVEVKAPPKAEVEEPLEAPATHEGGIEDSNDKQEYEKEDEPFKPNTEGTVETYIPTTREAWRGERTPSTFEAKVKAGNYSDRYKKKILAVHKYMTEKGAFSHINLGYVNPGDKVMFVVDPKLNEDAGTFIILMAVKDKVTGEYQIIGDCPSEEFDKDAFNKQKNMALLTSKIKSDYESREGDGLFISEYSTTVNKIYVGTPEFTNTKVNAFELGMSTAPSIQIGVVRNSSIVSSVPKTEIHHPLNAINGATVVLIPNGRLGGKNGYSIAYADNLKLSDYEGDYGLQPIILDILKRFKSVTDVDSIMSVMRELNKFIYAPDFHVDINNGTLQVRNGNNRKQLLLNTEADALAKELYDMIKDSTVQVNHKLFGTTVNGFGYEAMIAKYLNVNIGQQYGLRCTLNNWFGTNPLDENLNEVKGKTIRTTGKNEKAAPKKISENTIKFTNSKGKTFYVDPNAPLYMAVTDEQGNLSLDKSASTDEQTKDYEERKVAYHMVCADVKYGDKRDDVGLEENIADNGDGTWIDRDTGTLYFLKLEVENAIRNKRKARELADSKAETESSKLDNEDGTKSTHSDSIEDLLDKVELPDNVPTIDNIDDALSKDSNTAYDSDIADDIDDEFAREAQSVDTYEEADMQKEQSWLEKNLPQLSIKDRLKFKDGLIETRTGKTAYGTFKRGIITIANNAARGTIYHEAFHSVFHTLMSNSERLEVFRMAKKKWPSSPNTVSLEEELAEDFRRYTEDVEYSTPFKRFWKNLWNFIKTLGGKAHTLDALYYNINKGNYSNISPSYTDVIRNRLSIEDNAIIDRYNEYDKIYEKDVLKLRGKEELSNPYADYSEAESRISEIALRLNVSEALLTVNEYRGRYYVMPKYMGMKALNNYRKDAAKIRRDYQELMDRTKLEYPDMNDFDSLDDTERSNRLLQEQEYKEEQEQRAIEQWHREKNLYHNLSNEDIDFIDNLGISKEEWNSKSPEERESKLICRR